jgi:hypothetical protein
MMLKFAQVRPWWVRLAIVVAIGSPMITGGALHARLHEEHFFRDLAWWAAYSVFVWLFILICIGLERLIQWLSVAVVSGLTVALTGAALRKLKIWESVEHAVFWLTGAESAPVHQAELDLIFRLIIIMVSLPFALFVLNSFPAADLLKRIASRGPSKKALLTIKLALSLRIFQHVMEVVTTSLVSWREENPEIVLPRFRDDWRGTLLGRLKFFDWARTAVWAWCLTLTLHTLLIVPVVVRDFRRLLPEE